MYQYKHTVTGAVIYVGNPIFGGKWELVEAPTAAKAKEKPVAEEVEVIEETKTTKKATKKKG
jgi:hypothetical protein